MLKNLYILTTNIAGLTIELDSAVNDLYNNHLELMHNVLSYILKLQNALTNKTFDKYKLEQKIIKAFESDLKHKCICRLAHQRLKRTLELANQFQLNIKKINNSL